MNLGSLIEAHGYWVLALGCLLEGETVLVLAGFAAHSGYLNPFAVIAIAASAGFAGDQFFFWLGRHYGPAVLRRWPSVAAQQDRLERLMLRYQSGVVIGVRFAYGLRIAGPVLIGMSSIGRYRFALLNAAGAIVWACIIAGLGWVFGRAAQALMGEIRSVEGWLLLGIIGVAVLVWWVRRNRRV